MNSIPTAEEAAKSKWAEVQNQYQRRSDLIPNLVATVKGAANFEQSTLVKVTEARAKATSIQISASDLTDADKMAKFQAAQEQLERPRRLLVAAEAYPELKANDNFKTLQDQIERTENRIAIARLTTMRCSPITPRSAPSPRSSARR
jgi:LemA protein